MAAPRPRQAWSRPVEGGGEPEIETVGDRIREAREKAGLSQPDLARAIGLAHPQSISRYERGEHDVNYKRLRQIAEATGFPISFFTPEAVPPADIAQAVAELQTVTESLTESIARLEARQDQMQSESKALLEQGAELQAAAADLRSFLSQRTPEKESPPGA